MKWMGKKVGLVLGGGGVRGFSHIGVLKVLEEEGIDIDLIVGTSAGALIGGAYASGQAPDEIESKIDAYLQSPEFDDSRMKSIGLSFTQEEKNILKKAQQFIMNRVLFVQAFFKPSILPSHDFLSLMNYFLPDLDIKETRIPLHVVSTDLISGKKIVFSEGSLRKVVLASCAVPGAVEPVRYGDWLLADGGITSLVPVHAAREAGADVVIAVTVDRDLQTNLRIETAKDVVFRAGEITPSVLEAAELADADVIIRPQVGNLHWMDFKRAVDLVKAGESAARDSLKSIHASLPIYRRITRLAGKLFKQSRL
ncbi:MAG TPA: patatin-like phospholipase family protein [Smithella sp.]|jgi:NTE family protein|nr:MAG: NTE family protein RssA [Deltaproteobacteria bacterium ADurb.Bin022]HPL47072.1 patatin-like phospholipase family protein [Smithella sp.]HPR15574.1 patatin-like phospholipase family protein [Smithella sp.]